MTLKERVLAMYKLPHPHWRVFYEALLPEDKRWLAARGVEPKPNIHMQGNIGLRVKHKIIDKHGRDVTQERTKKHAIPN